jgi:hypothetical protein
MKQATVQAKTAEGVVVYDVTFNGLKNKSLHLERALAALALSAGVIRVQTVGAKTWAKYTKSLHSMIATFDVNAIW